MYKSGRIPIRRSMCQGGRHLPSRLKSCGCCWPWAPGQVQRQRADMAASSPTHGPSWAPGLPIAYAVSPRPSPHLVMENFSPLMTGQAPCMERSSSSPPGFMEWNSRAAWGHGGTQCTHRAQLHGVEQQGCMGARGRTGARGVYWYVKVATAGHNQGGIKTRAGYTSNF